jgi:hypothetical protein
MGEGAWRGPDLSPLLRRTGEAHWHGGAQGQALQEAHPGFQTHLHEDAYHHHHHTHTPTHPGTSTTRTVPTARHW